METLKPQPSLRGFIAYALRRFVERRGMTPAEGAAWMIDRWVDDNYERLKDRYAISLEDYELQQVRQWKESRDSS